MFNFNFIVVKLKKAFLPFLFCLLILSMLIFSKTNISSSKAGLELWANSIVPSLLPFFVASELLSHTFVVPLLGKLLNFITRPLFNVPGEGSFAFIMGIICGYPVGAKIVSKFYSDGTCSLVESERLISFTNNSGPLFILGTIGISFFGDIRTGILLLITHILACITVGIIFRFWKYNKSISYLESNTYNNKKKKNNKNNKNYGNISQIEDNINFSNLGEILSSSIMHSIQTILLIGGFVVMFSVIISIFNQTHLLSRFSHLITPIFNLLGFNSKLALGTSAGIFEITNGIKIVSSISIKHISQNIIITSFLLGFGGFSILFQVYSIISKVGISIKPYIIGKVLHGIIAALYTYIFINVLPLFNLDLL